VLYFIKLTLNYEDHHFEMHKCKFSSYFYVIKKSHSLLLDSLKENRGFFPFDLNGFLFQGRNSPQKKPEYFSLFFLKKVFFCSILCHVLFLFRHYTHDLSELDEEEEEQIKKEQEEENERSRKWSCGKSIH